MSVMLTNKEPVQLSEVFFRDGLQAFESEDLTELGTSTKVEVLERLLEAGVTDMEVTSFSHPGVVPQFKDAEQVVRSLPEECLTNGVARALVPNRVGLGRAIRAGLRHVTAFLTCSEAYQAKNVGMSIDEALAEIEEMHRIATDEGLRMSADVGCAFVCPFEGRIDQTVVHRVVGALADIGIHEITVADTLGMADPGSVYSLFKELGAAHPKVQYGAHLHNRHGVASIGVLAAIDAGVRKIDGALLGVGAGTIMPVDKFTMGNVPSEEVVYVLNSLGYKTGLEFDVVRSLARDVAKRISAVPYPRLMLHGSEEDYIREMRLA